MDADDARASPSERLDELRHRFAHLRRQLDLRAHVVAHPWEAVGTALVLGAWLGFDPPRVKPPAGRLGAAVVAMIGAIAVRLAREAAFRHLSTVAQRWWEETAHPPPRNS